MAAKKVSRKKVVVNPGKDTPAPTENCDDKVMPEPEPTPDPPTITLVVDPNSPVVDTQEPEEANPIPVVPPVEIAIAKPPTINANCKCKQKNVNGSYFCFRLVQGRWVQSSAIPYPTQELCEDDNCND